MGAQKSTTNFKLCKITYFNNHIFLACMSDEIGKEKFNNTQYAAC